MSVATTPDVLVSRNPATGAELGRTPVTPVPAVAEAVARARAAQAGWDAAGWPARRVVLRRWWKVLARDADAWARAIRDEVGKPRAEALGGDVVASLDGIRWTVRHAGPYLADRRSGPGHQRMLQVPAARLRHRPVGVVGMIGTWNYPLLLNAPPIAQALAAGCAVVWKPSEHAALAGRRLQASLHEAGLPEGLVGTVYGGAEVGRALVESEIDLGFFTGGVENGRRVLAALASRGVDCVAELSGFDPAVVLPDAPLTPTARALTWGAFLGAGQTCIAVKRVYVVGDARPWAEAIAAHARALRVGDPAGDDVDVGPLISGPGRDRFHAQVVAAVDAGAEVLAGGLPVDGPGWFYAPTVLLADHAGPEAALAGCFGPMTVVRGVPSVDDAVRAANGSEYGLAASVWGQDVRAATAVAARLDAGVVTVNEAVAPTLHASAPFGGVTASGHGRTRGPLGLREFTRTQVIFPLAAGGFRPHYFPYGGTAVDTFLGLYRRLFH